MEEVGAPPELVLGAVGARTARPGSTSGRDELVEGRLEVGALAVELVHRRCSAWQSLLDGELPAYFSVCTSTPSTPDTTTIAASAADRGPDVPHEVAVRGVEHVDLGVLPFDRAPSPSETEMAALLVRVVVGDRVAVLDRAHAVHGARGEQHRLWGLVFLNLRAHQQDVADILPRRRSSTRLPPCEGGQTRNPTVATLG